MGDDKKVIFYFVRHGQSAGNSAEVLSGHTDHALTEKGLEEARQTVRNAPTDYSAIYSSDLLRCKQTAEILNIRNLPIIYDKRLRERDFGTLSGKSWKNFDLDGSTRKTDTAQKYDYRPYGGESVEQVRDRVFACLEEIKNKTPEGEKIVIVTSAGIIRLLHLIYRNEEHAHIENASVHEFEL